MSTQDNPSPLPSPSMPIIGSIASPDHDSVLLVAGLNLPRDAVDFLHRLSSALSVLATKQIRDINVFSTTQPAATLVKRVRRRHTHIDRELKKLLQYWPRSSTENIEAIRDCVVATDRKLTWVSQAERIHGWRYAAERCWPMFLCNYENLLAELSKLEKEVKSVLGQKRRCVQALTQTSRSAPSSSESLIDNAQVFHHVRFSRAVQVRTAWIEGDQSRGGRMVERHRDERITLANDGKDSRRWRK